MTYEQPDQMEWRPKFKTKIQKKKKKQQIWCMLGRVLPSPTMKSCIKSSSSFTKILYAFPFSWCWRSHVQALPRLFLVLGRLLVLFLRLSSTGWLSSLATLFDSWGSWLVSSDGDGVDDLFMSESSLLCAPFLRKSSLFCVVSVSVPKSGEI